MKRLAILAIICTMWCSTAWASESTEIPINNEINEVNMKYATTTVNIRVEPNTECGVIGQLHLNDEVEVIGEADGWSQIIYDENICYVYGSYLSDEPVDNEWTSLGRFRITHYCSCSKCNGKWKGTASGRDMEVGTTIAVYKSQIPLGTEVMIDGHVYRADDTGSGIKQNCIDILVGSHEEAKKKGVYYTDVYVK